VSDLAPYGPIDQAAVLRELGLDPRHPKVQALLLVCGRYQLDPILSEACLINGRVFVTKAGLRHIAERSGDLDGIEVDIVEEKDRYVATAKVWRRSMTHPFTYQDECLKGEKVQSARKRAHTRAVRNALREAFAVDAPVYDPDEERPPPKIRAVPTPLPETERAAARQLPQSVERVEVGEGAGTVRPEPSPTLLDRPLAEPVFRGRPVEDTPPIESALSPVAKSLMMKFRELEMPDDVRHVLLGWVSEGRSESVKTISDEDAGAVHLVLHKLAGKQAVDGLPGEVAGWVATRG